MDRATLKQSLKTSHCEQGWIGYEHKKSRLGSSPSAEDFLAGVNSFLFKARLHRFISLHILMLSSYSCKDGSIIDLERLVPFRGFSKVFLSLFRLLEKADYPFVDSKCSLFWFAWLF